MNEQLLFERFISQLSHWSKTGEVPKLGDCDIRKYLELQNQRIEEKGLKRTYEYTINGKIYKVGDFLVGQLLNGYNRLPILCCQGPAYFSNICQSYL